VFTPVANKTSASLFVILQSPSDPSVNFTYTKHNFTQAPGLLWWFGLCVPQHRPQNGFMPSVPLIELRLLWNSQWAGWIFVDGGFILQNPQQTFQFRCDKLQKRANTSHIKMHIWNVMRQVIKPVDKKWRRLLSRITKADINYVIYQVVPVFGFISAYSQQSHCVWHAVKASSI
jgi:hypothetical protein